MTVAPTAPVSNPFCAARLRPGTINYVFAGDDSMAKLVDVLARNRWQGQIVGPHGSGKSTLLACLLDDLRRRGHDVCAMTLHDGQRALPQSSRHSPRAVRCSYGTRSVPATFIAIDGYEQLSYWNRWSLQRRCRRFDWGLIVTAHAPVGFATLHETDINPERAWEVVERLQRGHEHCIDREDLAQALGNHNGNLREALFELYDLYEVRSTVP